MQSMGVRALAGGAALCGVALVFGLAAGAAAGWAVLAASLGVALAWNLWQLRALRRWLAHPTRDSVPESGGAWDEVFAMLYRRERDQAKDRRRLLQELARNREAARALPEGAVILDADDRIEWCNGNSQRHFGIGMQRDSGQPVANLLRHPEFVAYLESGDYARPVQLARGETLLSVQLIPYGGARKLMLSRDVTQLVRLERMRRSFIANVSHELRTPLTVLVGFLETLRELKLDAERRGHYLGLMEEQARRMERIIEDLLRLSALESSPAPPRDDRVATGPLLTRVLATGVARSAGRHRLKLDADPRFDLLGAETELESAFANMVTNAVRYTPEGGEVRVAWRAVSGGAEFEVLDTGIGIAAEHIPRITERFYRVDRGRSRETGGTGLGLAIVKNALSRHEAELDIRSEPGKGSRFVARFPARRIAAAAAVVSAPEAG